LAASPVGLGESHLAATLPAPTAPVYPSRTRQGASSRLPAVRATIGAIDRALALGATDRCAAPMRAPGVRSLAASYPTPCRHLWLLTTKTATALAGYGNRPGHARCHPGGGSTQQRSRERPESSRRIHALSGRC